MKGNVPNPKRRKAQPLDQLYPFQMLLHGGNSNRIVVFDGNHYAQCQAVGLENAVVRSVYGFKLAHINHLECSVPGHFIALLYDLGHLVLSCNQIMVAHAAGGPRL